MTAQLLNKRQVMALLSISKTTLDVWRRDRGFPAPVNLFGINRWRSAEIEAWIQINAQVTMRVGLPRPAPSSTVQTNGRKP